MSLQFMFRIAVFIFRSAEQTFSTAECLFSIAEHTFSIGEQNTKAISLYIQKGLHQYLNIVIA